MRRLISTGQAPGPARRAARGIGSAAVLIGGITALARVIGFSRQLVFAHTVGSHCLGTAYATANQVPNIIYDIVIGGALSSVVVPVLAGAAARRPGPDGAGPDGRHAEAEAGQTVSALLSWAVLLLAPASVAIAVAAGPITSLLLDGSPGCNRGATAAVSAQMLAVFAPQILLYGLAVVLYGVLQAHRRFTAPALAPVVSSLVVIGAYLAFVPLARHHGKRLTTVPLPAELMLSIGTTAGVAALVLTALGPALRLRLRLRPTLSFPPGVARRVRALAAVGFATLAAQDASLVAVIVLANGHEGRGALVLYNYGWQMFFVPYAVLALPIATSVFPVLSASSGEAFNRTAAAATRGVMLVAWLGAALLAGVAWPAARLFAAGPTQTRALALTFLAFAPGLAGYGMAAVQSRVLFASHRNRAAAMALVGGWLVVTLADVALVSLVPARRVVPVLALGNTIGLTCAGLALMMAVRVAHGAGALRGAARAGGAGIVAAVAGAAVGMLSAAALPVRGFIPNACVSLLAASTATATFGVVVFLLDGRDLRALAARAAARLGR